MMLGPAVLFLLALSIARDGGGWFTSKDIAFLLVLGGLILARFLELQGGNARTADGEPASMFHLRRYVVMAIPLGLTVWLVANLIGNRSA